LERLWDWKNNKALFFKANAQSWSFCDWDKTLFTMVESATNAVRHVYILLFDEG
jgi:valyl-tRNA synthetase